jgi:hypothetical protein
MSHFESDNTIHRYLNNLSESLELEGTTHFDLLVCGGAALNVMGYVTRTTDDIDVLAFIIDGEDAAAKPFPPELKAAVERVAQTRGLPETWLNPGPANMQEFGLPGGIIQRASCRKYGELLTVRFLDRYDQIHLKLYAAVDKSGGKHLSDLKQLNPTSEQLVEAANWCTQQDPSEGFLKLLKWFLKEEGYGDVVREFEE